MPRRPPEHVNDAATIERLCNENLPLLRWWLAHAARRFPSIEYADLKSAGNFGLFRAAMHYMPERGKFSSYAVRWMHGLTCNIIRSRLTRPTFEQYGLRLNRYSHRDHRPAEAIVDEWVELCDHPRAGAILRGLLLEHRTMREICAELGLHHSRIGQLLNKFRARIEQSES